MDDAQCTGSTSSYARKYALNGMFLIDDNKDPDNAEPPAEKVVLISADQRTQILDLVDETKTDIAAFCKFFKIKSADQLPASKYEQAINMLNKKKVA